MIIGSMAESGSNRHPEFFTLLHKRRRRKLHTADELADDIETDKSALLKGLKGLIKPEVVKDGRQRKHCFRDDDLQWLQDEVAAGRIYPMRVDEDQIAQDSNALAGTIEKLAASVRSASKLVPKSPDQPDDVPLEKRVKAKEKIVDILSDLQTMAKDRDVETLAKAGLVLGEICQAIGRTERGSQDKS